MSVRAIARALGLGRNTVAVLLDRHQARREEGAPALVPAPRARPSKLDPHLDRIRELLERYPDITAQRVFEELRARGYDGGDNIVKSKVRALRPPPAPVISLPTMQYGPGKMGESDWSPYTIDFATGRRKIHVFAYVLVFSRRKAFSVHAREDVHALMDGHVRAFERFGGVTEECKYDCQKAVVLRFEGDQPLYNPRFVDFATYYEFRPVACRPAHPNDKPRVERSFWELERSFLNGRTFHDEADLSAQLGVWMDEVADRRIRRGGDQTAIERFAEEAPTLRPLPRRPYDTARVAYRLCDAEACVSWEGNRYEVPYEHAADFLPLRITEDEVKIYDRELHLIASHPRLPKCAQQRAVLDRRPPIQRRSDDRELLAARFDALGDDGARYFRGLWDRQPRSAAYHARKILGLRERYSSGDLAAAIRHAFAYSAFDHAAVARILEARARPRTLDEYIADRSRRRLERWLGEHATEPRSLDEYDALPCISGKRPSRKEAPTCPPPEHPREHLPPDPPPPEAAADHPPHAPPSAPPRPAMPATTTSDDESSDTSDPSGSST